MDSLIQQTRRRHRSAQDKTGEVGSSTRERKVPARKSVSFKEDKKKSPNWLQKQFSRQMSDYSYDPISDMDHAAAVAAAAYAITTFEESWQESYYNALDFGTSLTRSKSRREDMFPLEEPRSLSRRFAEQLSFIETDMQDQNPPPQKSPARKSLSMKKTPTFSDKLGGDEYSVEKHERQRKPISEPPAPLPIQPPRRTRSERGAPLPPPPPPPLWSPASEIKRQNSTQTGRQDVSTADAWEKAELAKIKARYEKLNRKIDTWEAKKRDKARRKLDKAEQSELEQKRRKGFHRFREDTEYIEQIAAGARAQAKKQKQTEELKAKEKAGVIRTTGKLPGKTCLCF